MNKTVEKVFALPKWLKITLMIIILAVVQWLKFNGKIGDLAWVVMTIVVFIPGGFRKLFNVAKKKLK